MSEVNQEKVNKELRSLGKAVTFFIITITSMFCIAAVLLIYGMLFPEKEKPMTPPERAYYTAASFVSSYLKAPSSADFAPYRPGYVTDHGNQKYSVYISVDAENSFGVKLRNDFSVNIHYDKDKWLLDGIKQIK